MIYEFLATFSILGTKNTCMAWHGVGRYHLRILHKTCAKYPMFMCNFDLKFQEI